MHGEKNDGGGGQNAPPPPNGITVKSLKIGVYWRAKRSEIKLNMNSHIPEKVK